MSEGEKKVNVPMGIPPTRLDNYLVAIGLGLSRTQIQKLIRDKLIRIPGKGVKPAFILAGGEEIFIEIPESEPLRLVPESIPLDIVYEDEHLIVVNKPPGMVVHPARGHFTGTLVHGVLAHANRLSKIGGQTRPGVVHRLDKDTSGLIIIAKTDYAHARLARELAERKIHREYIALAWGHMPQKSGKIEGNIGHHPKDHRKMAVVEKGRPAITSFNVLADYGFISLVSFELATGRTHQIRVHASHIGHPIFGDPEYGGREELLGGIAPDKRQMARKLLDLMQRQALHARKLEFVHPTKNERISLSAPIPEDITSVLKILDEGGFWRSIGL